MSAPITGTGAQVLAELGGTALLVFLGLMAEAQVATSPDGSLGGSPAVAAVWGVAVLTAMLAVGRISGAHINPAVTLALASCGRFPWRKVAPYCTAQMAGGLLAAGTVRWLTNPLIQRYDPALTIRSQAVFSTLPGPAVPTFTALANEVAATAVLVIAVLVLLDRATENPLFGQLAPALIGLVVTAIGLSMGALSGWAINPARDLPPRLVEAITGYATAWQDQNGNAYWWVPVAGPLLGGVLGAALYRLPGYLRPALDPIAAGRDAARDALASPPVAPPVPTRAPLDVHSWPSWQADPEPTTDRFTTLWPRSPAAPGLASLLPPDGKTAGGGTPGEQVATLMMQAYQAGRWYAEAGPDLDHPRQDEVTAPQPRPGRVADDAVNGHPLDSGHSEPPAPRGP